MPPPNSNKISQIAAELTGLPPTTLALPKAILNDLQQKDVANALWQTCQFHGTAPLAYHNLKSNDAENTLPSSIGEQFKQSYYQTLAKNLEYTEILQKLGLTLDGLPVIILKGPVLISRVYQNPALRPMTDIDLLVEEQHLDTLKTYLAEMSFLSAPEYPDILLRDNAQIDLHTHPFNTDRIEARAAATPLELADIWNNAETYEAIPTFLTLNPAHQILSLSIHALKHGFQRNIWLLDILGCIGQATSTDQWQNVVECCQKARAQSILAYALHAIELRLQGKIPEQAQKLQKSFPIGPIRRKILLKGNPQGDFQLLEPLAVMHAIPGYRNKVRSLIEFIFPRKPVLQQISGLSGRFAFYLSYPLRIAQIMFRGTVQIARFLKLLATK